tara:strand:- start:4734 stop:5192 length:459 start_codon:yes stop_codon:yes gene_type:complete
MANYDFKQDLVVGEQGETVIMDDLISLGAKFIDDNKDNKYDLLMEKGGKQIKYEIKTDVYCKPTYDTGNMFIEFECRGKASGILVTQANWFVMYYKHLKEAWYIKTEDLKNIVENEDNNIRITQFSGDSGSNTRGYLVPRHKYQEKFIVRTI